MVNTYIFGKVYGYVRGMKKQGKDLEVHQEK